MIASYRFHSSEHPPAHALRQVQTAGIPGIPSGKISVRNTRVYSAHALA